MKTYQNIKNLSKITFFQQNFSIIKIKYFYIKIKLISFQNLFIL